LRGRKLGVPRDPARAADWWRKAALRHDADGQAMLGAAYHLGAGVPHDAVEAFTWLTRARQGNSPLASQFFEAVRRTLTPDEIAEAERRAKGMLETPLEAAP
jgi:TPR repeat protein